jgi:hypothetical protein
VTPLYGHTSEATAYLVTDYPYGSLRCQIKFWLESDPKKGARFCSQTQNPKNGRWNAVKKSTYSRFGGCMYLNEVGHVVWDGLSEYDDGSKVLAFVEKFPKAELPILRDYLPIKVKYLRAIADGKVFTVVNGEKSLPADDRRKEAATEADAWEAAQKLLETCS